MNEQSVKDALEAAASNPKVAGVVAAATTSLGTISILSQIQTVLGIISVGIGIVIGIYVVRINRTKSKIYERMLANGESFKE